MDSRQAGRRRFLKHSMQALAATVVSDRRSLPAASAAGANERFRVALVGCGGRGTYLATELFRWRKDVEFGYVCDPDSHRMQGAARTIGKLQRRDPKLVTDFRQTLDDRTIDVVINATPDHWHALPTILACQAGKDVYTEKPASHNIWEGQQMVRAADRYRRVVQMANQSRSGTYIRQAIDYINSGSLGSIHLVKIFNMKCRDGIGHQPDGPVPAGVDYDLWLGPAPQRPFNPNRFHYTWHWYWDYSGGDIINDAVHQIDIARWLVDRPYPRSVTATGGKHFHDDDQETPDTQVVLYEYDHLTMVFELTLWTPYMKKTSAAFRDTDAYPAWLQNATRIEVYGSKAMMMMGRQGDGWQVFGADGKVLAQEPGREPLAAHLANFFDCVQSRRQPNSPILEGHRSTLLCQLGNISYRLGGRRLAFDGATETIIDDAEAQKLAKRAGREPYAIPEIV